VSNVWVCGIETGWKGNVFGLYLSVTTCQVVESALNF